MSRNIPSVEVNNYATIFTAPIFKNQNGEWYRDVGYSDSIDIIRENFLGARKSFVAIGYYLKHIKALELYKEGGYSNIWECAKEEFGLSQPAASNYMKMNDTYSVNGDTPILDEKYAGFNKSQLQEMLALPEEMRKRIVPEQKVTDIRDIVKEEKGSKEPNESEIMELYALAVKDMDDEPRNTLKDRLRERYRHRFHDGGKGKIRYEGSSRGISINGKEEITWSYLVKLIEKYCTFPNETKGEEEKKDEQLPGQMNVKDYPGIVPEQKHTEIMKQRATGENFEKAELEEENSAENNEQESLNSAADWKNNKQRVMNNKQRVMLEGMDRLLKKFIRYPNDKEFSVEEIIKASNEVYEEILEEN